LTSYHFVLLKAEDYNKIKLEKKKTLFIDILTGKYNYFSKQVHIAAMKRSAAERSVAARTKGSRKRSATAKNAARTRTHA
jgi:hypothetical protein